MAEELENISLYEQIKTCPEGELDLIAEELRDELIQDVAKTGGHLASNLGSVELTIALHRVFDSPKDRIVWDVGHQAYIHKMITGRREEMATLRQLGGLSGFPK
ncbi:MAG: 1-deoxy-D-xylulose-5-phosphate synthase, partial [Firmicutes bacterium]|nr:1-deoxy-D-xylulose-5-phosphate synthase [Bacillota bacterium]